MFKSLLLVGTGGFLGSIARFLTSKYMQDNFPSAFPFGTFFVNISGCFLIGLIYGFSEKSSSLTLGWKLFLAVGFCGGFTTFSTFANENLALLRDGDFFHFFLYTGLSIIIWDCSYSCWSLNNENHLTMNPGDKAKRIRIYISSTDKFDHKPLYEVLIYSARNFGITGATVIKGIMGYGASSTILQ